MSAERFYLGSIITKSNNDYVPFFSETKILVQQIKIKTWALLVLSLSLVDDPKDSLIVLYQSKSACWLFEKVLITLADVKKIM